MSTRTVSFADGSRYRPTALLGYAVGDLPALVTASCPARARGRGKPAPWLMGRAGTCRRFARAGWSSADAHRPKPDPPVRMRLQPVVIPAQRRQIVPTRTPAGNATHMVQITLGTPDAGTPGTGNADAARPTVATCAGRARLGTAVGSISVEPT